MKILTLLGFLVLFTTMNGPNAVPIPVYLPQPVAGSNFGSIALAIIVFSFLLRPSPPPPTTTTSTTATTTPPALTCPTGYTLSETVCGRSCYRLESQICSTFENARAACRADGADLLEPDVCSFPFFQDLAMQAAGGTCRKYWIGALAILTDRTYLTVREIGLPNSFIFWATNEPSRTRNMRMRQACVQMDDASQYMLNDEFCTNSEGYICQTFL